MWIPIQSPPNAPVRTKTNVLLYNDCILMLGGSDTYGRIDSVLWSYNLSKAFPSIRLLRIIVSCSSKHKHKLVYLFPLKRLLYGVYLHHSQTFHLVLMLELLF